MRFEEHDIAFIDSLNFIPLPLSDFREAFGLSTELQKGDFPHRFNRTENQDYVGPMPELHWYDPDSKKPEARAKLVEWHAEEVRKGPVFNLKEELKKYCINDVAMEYIKCGSDGRSNRHCLCLLKGFSNVFHV